MAEGQFEMSQTADSDIAKIREDEFESKSGSDNIEGHLEKIKMANAGLVRSDIIAILSTKFRRWKCKFYF